MAKTILVKPVITEKATKLTDKYSTYVFVVGRDVNKIEVKNAIEATYNVNVMSVNTMIMPGKPKSRSTKTAVVRGRKAPYKKAFVRLMEGETIDIFGSISEE